MRRVPTVSVILVGVVLFGVSGARAQSTPRKTKSPAEVEQAVNDYNAKIMNCRSQARAETAFHETPPLYSRLRQQPVAVLPLA